MNTRITLTLTFCCLALPLVTQSQSSLTTAEQTLLEAAYLGKLDVVQQLVSGGVSVNTSDIEKRTPLMLAAFNGHTAVAEYLLNEDAEVSAKDSNGRTALLYGSSGPF
ncbi:MAG: ankyrin repeat domain-containing protein, partial [bacterium]|nr:ankyrin repeat domain-containing protein [bacterium]